MNTRKDFRVTVKVRNNNILIVAEAMGLSMPKLAAKAGIPYSSLHQLVSMTGSPFNAKGEVRAIVDKLCIATKKSFDELFSQEQCVALETNKSEAELDAEQVFSLMHQQPTSIEHDDGLKAITSQLLGRLKPKEKRVIGWRFGVDGEEPLTLEEIAIKEDLSSEQIRKIEAKALRKLRHPRTSTALLPFVNRD